jgi:hypothetical protein
MEFIFKIGFNKDFKKAGKDFLLNITITARPTPENCEIEDYMKTQ